MCLSKFVFFFYCTLWCFSKSWLEFLDPFEDVYCIYFLLEIGERFMKKKRNCVACELFVGCSPSQSMPPFEGSPDFGWPAQEDSMGKWSSLPNQKETWIMKIKQIFKKPERPIRRSEKFEKKMSFHRVGISSKSTSRTSSKNKPMEPIETNHKTHESPLGSGSGFHPLFKPPKTQKKAQH